MEEEKFKTEVIPPQSEDEIEELYGDLRGVSYPNAAPNAYHQKKDWKRENK
jgi:hypothetical protein